jgi:hypothetical protein
VKDLQMVAFSNRASGMVLFGAGQFLAQPDRLARGGICSLDITRAHQLPRSGKKCSDFRHRVRSPIVVHGAPPAESGRLEHTDEDDSRVSDSRHSGTKNVPEDTRPKVRAAARAARRIFRRTR